MSSKQEYEARKAARIADEQARHKRWEEVSKLDAVIREKTTTLELLVMADRFVSAVERIADALDSGSLHHTTSEEK